MMANTTPRSYEAEARYHEKRANVNLAEAEALCSRMEEILKKAETVDFISANSSQAVLQEIRLIARDAIAWATRK